MGYRPLVGKCRNSPGVRYLSFRPTGSKNLKTVTLVPNRTGTVILASVGNPEDILIQEAAAAGRAAGAAARARPPPPSSRWSRAPPRARPSSWCGATPDAVREFYRKELAQRGYAPWRQARCRTRRRYEKNGDDGDAVRQAAHRA